MIPVARDGSMFTRSLSRGGVYTVGPKGDEHRFDSYEQALHFLQNAPRAHWRRPNSESNWGIVTGVSWAELYS